LTQYVIEQGRQPSNFNMRSPEQISDLFFNPKDKGGLGLVAPPNLTKTAKGKYSTDQNTLMIMKARK